MPTKPKVELSEFAAAVKPSKRKTCFFARLSPEQQTKVIEAEQAGYVSSVIASVVTGWGVPIKDNRVRAHFNGGCSCE